MLTARFQLQNYRCLKAARNDISRGINPSVIIQCFATLANTE